MPTPEYLIAYKKLRKREQPRHSERWDQCPVTDEVMDNVVLVVAPPDYPQLADGLEIGAVYEYEHEDSSWYCIAERSLDGYFFEWCGTLVKLVAGRELKGGPFSLVDWCNKLSEMMEDKEKYPETDGRGPFWELLRYNLRGMTYGPVVCAKLVADFDDWDPEIWFRSDEKFYNFYRKMRECFSCARDANSLVTYPRPWMEGGKFFIEPKLGADPNRRW